MDALSAYPAASEETTPPPASPARSPRSMEIAAIVASAHDMTAADLLADTRKHAVSHARQIAMYLTRELTDLSLPQIASKFGGFDHTTVLYACRKVARRVREDAEFRRKIAGIRSSIAEFNVLAGGAGAAPTPNAFCQQRPAPNVVPMDPERARALVEAGFYPLTPDGRLKRSFRVRGVVN